MLMSFFSLHVQTSRGRQECGENSQQKLTLTQNTHSIKGGQIDRGLAPAVSTLHPLYTRQMNDGDDDELEG
jgi:hypothetical protein